MFLPDNFLSEWDFLLGECFSLDYIMSLSRARLSQAIMPSVPLLLQDDTPSASDVQFSKNNLDPIAYI